MDVINIPSNFDTHILNCTIYLTLKISKLFFEELCTSMLIVFNIILLTLMAWSLEVSQML